MSEVADTQTLVRGPKAGTRKTLVTTTKMVFVFGSNAAGVHGAGAALVAYKQHGARMRHGYGMMGNSFAIPTKDINLRTLPRNQIQRYVEGFIAYAEDFSHLKFQVTCIGCGLAGYTHESIAPMFFEMPKNCLIDKAWSKYLPNHHVWGTF